MLAFLSVTGGWIGVPGSLGGSNHFDKFLGPVFHSRRLQGAPRATESQWQQNPKNPKRERAMPPSCCLREYRCSRDCSALCLAWLLYYRDPQLPQRIAAGLGGLYQAVVHKYYIDELYATLFVKPLIAGSALILWHGIDQDVIDASLDNSAHGAREISDSVRHMQSGNLRSYAGWIAAGAAAVIAYMIWMGTR